ncbi:hypothetical protein [uncultured Ruminococcus sp.]|jgi:hypothetical protein|uniref:hypothetical protein n=1 Tax=uncultured Ruminococcus sp. TaxID=165186 RepID=UPI00266CE376|nr:hypothetical protein [uncultured Ruminococcus sp.]
MKELKNRAEIVAELAKMLREFDLALNPYDTDVYLYYDKAEKTAELDTFVNPSGRSWLDDDHDTIYTDYEHHTTYFDGFDNLGDLADAVGTRKEELIKKAAKYADIDVEDVDYHEVARFIKSDDNLMEKLHEAYKICLDELEDNYDERADYIISEWESNEERS